MAAKNIFSCKFQGFGLESKLLSLRTGIEYATFCNLFCKPGKSALEAWTHLNLLCENLLKLTLCHHLFYSTESFSNTIPCLTSFLVCSVISFFFCHVLDGNTFNIYSHGDLLTAEETSVLLPCYLNVTYL